MPKKLDHKVGLGFSPGWTKTQTAKNQDHKQYNASKTNTVYNNISTSPTPAPGTRKDIKTGKGYSDKPFFRKQTAETTTQQHIFSTATKSNIRTPILQISLKDIQTPKITIEEGLKQ